MTTFWTDPESAVAWARNDAQRDLLALPRAIVAEIVRNDRPNARHVVDIGSGPGAFLLAVLPSLPEAHGLWVDVSEVMMALARENLSDFADRMDYEIADMADLTGLPGDIDLVVTSRAAHHLTPDGLRTFYREIAEHLTPGGWLANLDHTSPTESWNARFRSARKALIPRTGEQARHHHDFPPATVEENLAALRDAGFSDIAMPWRAFHTCLLMARRAG